MQIADSQLQRVCYSASLGCVHGSQPQGRSGVRKTQTHHQASRLRHARGKEARARTLMVMLPRPGTMRYMVMLEV